MNLRPQYEKETGKSIVENVFVHNGESESNEEDYFTDEYTEWLEAKLNQFKVLWSDLKDYTVFYENVPEEAAEIDNLLNKSIPFN